MKITFNPHAANLPREYQLPPRVEPLALTVAEQRVVRRPVTTLLIDNRVASIH